MPPSKQPNSGRKRTARRETAGASERKIRRLAEMTMALREGTQNYFEVTRLTSVSFAQPEGKSFIPMRFHTAG